MLEPPPPKLKKIRRSRAYSFNKRPAPVPKKRQRTSSHRNPNKNLAKVSVKRGSKKLTGRDKRTRIYELLYFIPTTVKKALTPKQLDLLLQKHSCAICQKVFRLSSGVKFHMKDHHENERPQTLYEHTPKKDKNNQSLIVRKPSIKNFFSVRKPPRYIAKPLGLTLLTNNNKNKPPHGSGYTPKLTTNKKWREKKLSTPLISSRHGENIVEMLDGSNGKRKKAERSITSETSDDVAKHQMFSPGDLVLVKFPVYGYWPAKIDTQKVNAFYKKGGRRIVCFGEKEKGFAFIDNMKYYDDNCKVKYISKSSMKKYPALRKAVKQISWDFRNGSTVATTDKVNKSMESGVVANENAKVNEAEVNGSEEECPNNSNAESDNVNYTLDLEVVEMRTEIRMSSASFARVGHLLPSGLAVQLRPDDLKASTMNR